MTRPLRKSNGHRDMKHVALALALIMLIATTGCKTESTSSRQDTQEQEPTETTLSEEDTNVSDQEYEAPENAKRYSDLERILQELKRETN